MTPDAVVREREAIEAALKPEHCRQESGSTDEFDEMRIQHALGFFNRKAREWDELSEDEKRRRADAARQEEETRLEAEFEEARVRKLAVVPPEYVTASVTHAAVRAWLEDFRAGRKLNLVLCGPTGTGKTHNSFGILRALIGERDLGWQYRQVPLLLSALRPRPDSSEWEELSPVLSCTLLVLDDVGAHKRSEWTDEKLYEIADYRRSHRRPTVSVTNVDDPGGFKAAVGERVYSRLCGGARVVVFKGSDRRFAA